MSHLAYVLVGVVLLTREINCKEVSNIINGKEAGEVVIKEWYKYVFTTTEFPYVAALEYKTKYKCGAAIITNTTLLTAAHCVEGIAATDLLVRAGTFWKEDKNGVFAQIRNVSKTISHQKYKAIKYGYDIAIIRLAEPFRFGDHIRAIQMANSSQMEGPQFKRVVAVGLGETEGFFKSSTLKRANFKVLSRSECKKKNVHITRSMICTIGNDGPAGVGKGDSGSPLIAMHNYENPEQDILIGITTNCIKKPDQGENCNADFPSVFINIAVFRKWIDKNIYMNK